jgi:hypothetical protein
MYFLENVEFLPTTITKSCKWKIHFLLINFPINTGCKFYDNVNKC